MKKESKVSLIIAVALLLCFILWTAAVSFIDVQAIGPEGSSVGFSKINGFVHRLTGVHMLLYDVTDALSIIPLGTVIAFGGLGAAQWIKRKKLWAVDKNLFVLGSFYVLVMAFFLVFQVLVINYRPVLIEGQLEASYPSSTTMLVMCVMPTAVMQLKERLRSRFLFGCTAGLISAFTAFMVMGRLISGVHWFSDIIGGALLSAALVMLYRFFVSLTKKLPLTDLLFIVIKHIIWYN